MVNLKIKVTKEILQRSKMCSSDHKDHLKEANQSTAVGSNCAIALAVREIFPDGFVEGEAICPFEYSKKKKLQEIKIPLPWKAIAFIEKFDINSPEERILMKPIEFKVELPDKVIDQINIQSFKEVLKQSSTLELCQI